MQAKMQEQNFTRENEQQKKQKKGSRKKGSRTLLEKTSGFDSNR